MSTCMKPTRLNVRTDLPSPDLFHPFLSPVSLHMERQHPESSPLKYPDQESSGTVGLLALVPSVLTSSFFSFSVRTSFWFWVYSISMRASWRRSSSSAARRPLYSASSRHASSTVFERRSAASLSAGTSIRAVRDKV